MIKFEMCVIIDRVVVAMAMAILLLVLATTGAAIEEHESSSSQSIAKPGCREKCGNVTVPYPFGIISSDCALNGYFFLNCTTIPTDDGNGHREALFLRKYSDVINIDVNGTLSVRSYAAYNCSGSRSGSAEEDEDEDEYEDEDSYLKTLDFGDSPFTISGTGNMLTAVGCSTVVWLTNPEYTFGAACLSLCDASVPISDNSTCEGTGCCQTSIPKGLKSMDIQVRRLRTSLDVSGFNPCAYGFLAEKSTHKLSEVQLSRPYYPYYKPSMLLDWVAQTNETCAGKEGQSICGNNTACSSYPDNPKGYRCVCKLGYQGNPYLQQGCIDIDECKDPETNTCHDRCENTDGDYSCRCPVGMYGDGRKGCHGLNIKTVFQVIGAIICLVIIVILIYGTCLRKRREKNFRENGGIVLKNQRVRIFTEAELKRATKNYDESLKLGEGGFGSVYEGILTDNTRIAVKKSKVLDKQEDSNGDFQQEMAMVSQVNHKNVVQLLGMCLETKVPLLVYEYIANGNLSEHIHQKKSQVLDTWKNRLRIAAETALALDYLHSLANPPIIHGDIKPVNILLDDTYTAKIADFGASVLISQEEPDVATKIKGTFGYLDPEYLMTGILSSKSDVYSFGIVLLELLTGEKPNRMHNIIHNFISKLETNRLPEILSFQVADESEMDEVEEVAYLAKRCVNATGENRPSMSQVSEELARLMRPTHERSFGQESSEEIQRLLGDQSPPNLFSTNNIGASLCKSHSYSVMSLRLRPTAVAYKM